MQVCFHLARPHQQADHKTTAPISQHCPGSPPPTIPKHPVHQKNDVPLQPPILHKNKNNAFLAFQTTNTIFSDQIGALPIISSRGYCYIMFVYIYNINKILMHFLKIKAGAEQLQTFKDVQTLLLHRGLQPKYFRMDNECSSPIKKYITDNKMKLQLTLSVTSRLEKPTS